MPNILELNILQSLPVNCLNRDDTNSVKTVDIGGVTRRNCAKINLTF